MSKAKFAAAKELIQQKKYPQARALLATIDDPLARQWEAKLDKLAPVKRSNSTLIVSGAIAAVVILLLVVVVLVIASRPKQTEVAALATIAQSAAPTLSPVPSATIVPTWTPTPECNMAGWWKANEPTVVDFLDTAETATRTSRASLSPIVLELNTLYRQWDRLEHDTCASDLYIEVDLGMSNAVDGFNDFLSQDEFSSEIDFKFANQHFWNADQILGAADILSTDYRLGATQLIWGADEGSSENATQSAIDLATIQATFGLSG